MFEGDCQAHEIVQEAVVKFVKGLCHVSLEAALNQMWLSSLALGYHICTYKIAHGLLNFPWGAVLVPSSVLGFAAVLARYTKSGVTTEVTNMPPAFE